LGTLSGASTLTTNFLLTDSVGSVVSTISNTAGSAAVQGNQVYGPYGNKRYSAGNMGTAKGFTGQYADDLTGFDYYVARYYDPVSARFLSADTVQGNMQGMDPYDYVGGNPETRNDPSGHCWPWCTMAIGAVVGGLIGGGVSLVTQLATTHSVNWGEVGTQTVIGAVGGALTGLAGPEAGAAAEAAVATTEAAAATTEVAAATTEVAAATTEAAAATTDVAAASTTDAATTAATTDTASTVTSDTASTVVSDTPATATTNPLADTTADPAPSDPAASGCSGLSF
jgi:RHS repeat-associated protein